MLFAAGALIGLAVMAIQPSPLHHPEILVKIKIEKMAPNNIFFSFLREKRLAGYKTTTTGAAEEWRAMTPLQKKNFSRHN
jgi:hypothetical protein